MIATNISAVGGEGMVALLIATLFIPQALYICAKHSAQNNLNIAMRTTGIFLLLLTSGMFIFNPFGSLDENISFVIIFVITIIPFLLPTLLIVPMFVKRPPHEQNKTPANETDSR